MSPRAQAYLDLLFVHAGMDPDDPKYDDVLDDLDEIWYAMNDIEVDEVEKAYADIEDDRLRTGRDV